MAVNNSSYMAANSLNASMLGTHSSAREEGVVIPELSQHPGPDLTGGKSSV